MDEYIVQQGDTLSEIAANKLGNAGRGFPKFAQLNNLKEPYLIWPGQLLQLPPQGTRKGGVITARATGPGKTEKRTNPPSLMLFNFEIDGATLKEEHKAFLRMEALPTLRSGGSVRVIGLTDRRGSAAHNKALSEQRVAGTVEFLSRELPTGLNLKQSTAFGEDARFGLQTPGQRPGGPKAISYQS